MGVVLSLTVRNMKLYFRDKASVFYSLMGAMIVLLLYVLFLGNTQVNSIAEEMPNMDRGDIEFLVNSWMIGGILAIACVTTALGALGTMVDDRLKGVNKDFMTAPIKRWQLVASYIIAAIISSTIINTILLAAGEAYLVISGGQLLEAGELIKVFGLVVLCCASFTAISAFLVTLTKTSGAFAGLSTIMGTLIGFLSGSYMPIGVFPSAVQAVVKVLPFSYAAALFRMIFTKVPMDKVFAGAPDNIRILFEEDFGMRLVAFSKEISAEFMLLIIAATGLLFFALAIVRMSGRVKK